MSESLMLALARAHVVTRWAARYFDHAVDLHTQSTLLKAYAEAGTVPSSACEACRAGEGSPAPEAHHPKPVLVVGHPAQAAEGAGSWLPRGAAVRTTKEAKPLPPLVAAHQIVKIVGRVTSWDGKCQAVAFAAFALAMRNNVLVALALKQMWQAP